MGMLDRIKKRQDDGFKEFVINMETTGGQTRAQIFTAGVLEDPLYMSFVMKNIKTFDDFLQLGSDDIDTVLKSQEQMLTLFAKCLFGVDEAKLADAERSIPRLVSRFRDEMSYIKDASPQEIEGARFHMIKVARKLQIEELIRGFQWKFPPHDIYYPKQYKDGPAVIHFENGAIAAEGMYLRGKRSGTWRHNYDGGAILAQGDYHDGLKTGKWTFYYSSGSPKAEGKYRSDLKHGMWKEWDRNGHEVEIEYHEGVKSS